MYSRVMDQETSPAASTWINLNISTSAKAIVTKF